MNCTNTRRRSRRDLLAGILLALTLSSACGGRGGGASDFPSGSPPFHTDYELALADARAQDKPAVVVFSAAWCPPCRANKANVYPSAQVKALHADFVWAYLDTDQSRNRPVAERFGVSGIPHIQLVDPSGAPLGAPLVGGTSPDAFARDLSAALAQFRG